MALYYSYRQLRTIGSIQSGQLSRSRHRPVVAIWVTGPAGTLPIDACLDSASDDSVFPKSHADLLDIDLTNATKGSSRAFGGAPLTYLLTQVTLRICDGGEECQWDATVGFFDQPMHWAILGHAGFLDYFTTELHGDKQQTVLTPNSAFPGRHTVFATP